MDLQIKAQANNVAELFIYGPIGREDNNPKDFISQLKSMNAETLHIHINSPGGDLFAGHAIYGMIKNFKGKKITYIDGLAASAASIIAMAGDEVVMPKNTLLMIHNASTLAYGDSQEFIKTADSLIKMNLTMQAVYCDKTNLPPEQVTAMMNTETWLTAAEAKELGFVDIVTDEIKLDSYFDNNNHLVINGVGLGSINHNKVKGILLPQSVAANVVVESLINNKEPKLMDIEALKKDYPELHKQIEAAAYEQGKQAGVSSERVRIQAIEEIGIAGHDKLIIDAKFTSGVSAEVLAMKILAAEKAQRTGFLADRNVDATALDGIVAQSVPDNKSQEAEFLAVFNEGVPNAK